MPERRTGTGSSTPSLPVERGSFAHKKPPRVQSKETSHGGNFLDRHEQSQKEAATPTAAAAARAKDRTNLSSVRLVGSSSSNCTSPAGGSQQAPTTSAVNKPVIPASVLQKLGDLYHQRHDDAASFWGIYDMLTQGANMCISPPNLVRALLHVVRDKVVVEAAAHLGVRSDGGATAVGNETAKPLDSGRGSSCAASDGDNRAAPTSSTILDDAAAESPDAVVIADLTGPLLMEEFLAVAEYLMTSSEYSDAFLEDERAVLQLAVLGERSLLLAPNSGQTSARNLPPRPTNAPVGAGKAPPTPRALAGNNGVSALREVLAAARAAVAPYCHTRMLGADAAAAKKRSADLGEGSEGAFTPTATVDMDLDAIWRALSSRGAHHRRRSSTWQSGGDGGFYDEGVVAEGGTTASSGAGGSAEDPFSAETKRLLQRMTSEDISSDGASQTTRGSRGLGAAGFGALTDYSSSTRGSTTKLTHSRLQIRKSFSHSLMFSGSSPLLQQQQQQSSQLPQSPTSPVDDFDALGDESPASNAKRHAALSGHQPHHRRQDSAGVSADSESGAVPSLTNAEAILQQLSLGLFAQGTLSRDRTGDDDNGKDDSGGDPDERQQREEGDAAVLRPPISRRQSVLEQYENRRRTTRLANLSFSFGPSQSSVTFGDASLAATGAGHRGSVSSHIVNPDPDIEEDAVRQMPSQRRGLPPTSRRTSAVNPSAHPFADLDAVESSWVDACAGVGTSINATTDGGLTGDSAAVPRRASPTDRPPPVMSNSPSFSPNHWHTCDEGGTGTSYGSDEEPLVAGLHWGNPSEHPRMSPWKEGKPFVLSKKEKRLMCSKRMTTDALTRELDSLGSDVVSYIPKSTLKQIAQVHPGGALHPHFDHHKNGCFPQQRPHTSSAGLPPHPAASLVGRPATSTSSHATEGAPPVEGFALRPSTAPNPTTQNSGSLTTSSAARLQNALHFSHVTTTATASPQLFSPSSNELSAALRPKSSGAATSGGEQQGRPASPSSMLRSRPVSTASHASRRTAPMAKLAPLTDEESEFAMRNTPQLRSWMKGGKTW